MSIFVIISLIIFLLSIIFLIFYNISLYIYSKKHKILFIKSPVKKNKLIFNSSFLLIIFGSTIMIFLDNLFYISNPIRIIIIIACIILFVLSMYYFKSESKYRNKCPLCASEISFDLNNNQKTIFIVCSNESCDFLDSWHLQFKKH